MEYKKNQKKISFAFKEEVAMKTVANKRRLEEEKPDDAWNLGILKNENGQNQPAKLDIKH